MRTTVVVCAALLLTGCSGGAEDDVAGAADDWAEALAAQDWASACELLAPRTREELEKSAGKPCEQALPEEATVPEAGGTQVDSFGQAAQVSWQNETVFLGDHAGEWLVQAAGCRATGHQLPYDCDIAGG